MRSTFRNIAIISFALLFLVFAGIMMSVSTKTLEVAEYPLDYKDIVYKAAEKYDVPVSVIYAVIKTESKFDTNAESYVGARGLMQLMEISYEWIDSVRGVSGASWNDFYEPEINIDYGTWLLRYLYDKFGSWETVYAAYNAGMTKIGKWLKNPEYSDDGINIKNYPSKSVSEYVEKVSSNRKGYMCAYDFN